MDRRMLELILQGIKNRGSFGEDGGDLYIDQTRPSGLIFESSVGPVRVEAWERDGEVFLQLGNREIVIPLSEILGKPN